MNADEIAKGISPFNPEGAALAAGRVMLSRINELLEQGESFAFETTLATRSYVGLIKKAQHTGYFVTLIFLALPNAEMAINRVRNRVLEGGHHIPKKVIITRFAKGLNNFFQLFAPIANRWMFAENADNGYKLIATGQEQELLLHDSETWEYYKFVGYGS